MRSVRLEVIECEHTGEKGFRPFIFSKWDSYIAGTQLGHDLIDHTTKEWGEIWQEFRAFGANIFVSEFGGLDRLGDWFEGNTQTEKKGRLLATELEGIIRDSEGYTPDLPMAKKVKFDDSIEECFAELWKAYSKFFEDSFSEDDENYDAKEYFDTYSDAILSWFRYGYKLAQNRFADDAYSAWIMKNKINTELLNAWKLNDFMIGEEVSIRFDVHNHHVEVVRKWDY